MKMRVSDAVLLMSIKVSGVQNREWLQVMDKYGMSERELEEIKRHLALGKFKIK